MSHPERFVPDEAAQGIAALHLEGSEALDVYEDWDLDLRLSLGRRLVYERCPAARYRIRRRSPATRA